MTYTKLTVPRSQCGDTLYITSPYHPRPSAEQQAAQYCVIPDYYERTTSKYETPSSEGCQYFMAERCSETWDDVCDMYYLANTSGTDRMFPNVTSIAPTSFGDCNNTDLGTSMLLNAATLKYYDHLGSVYHEPLNPLDPQSVIVSKYTRSNDYQRPVLKPISNIRALDDDPILQRLMLAGNSTMPFLRQLQASLYASPYRNGFQSTKAAHRIADLTSYQ